MEYTKVYEWIRQQETHINILVAMHQPLTAKQIAKRTGIPVGSCSYTITKFAGKGLLSCLNLRAKSSRLYGLSEFGIRCQTQLRKDLSLPHQQYTSPDIDWSLYGWICFSHRAAVIKTLTIAMQPSEIKRTLRFHKPHIPISANNIRDVVRLLLSKSIVRPVKVIKRVHLRYELTDLGIKLRQLLIQAEAGI